MHDLCMTIRRAAPDDLHAIWSLLHAQSFAWSEERIRSNMGRFFLLVQDKKLIGVLLAEGHPKERIEWIAIHPFFPETPYRNLLTEAFHRLNPVGQLHRYVLNAPVPAL